MAWIDDNCDGAGPHSGDTVRAYPFGCDGRAILCQHCWATENRFNWNRGNQSGDPALWPQHSWNEAEIYAKEGAGHEV